ncbi:hypothetical protein P7B02_04145 [Caulobacter segnis]|uniref:hypothetical protein n=1 Tax=Caulobacter segnis TaxID=88688 RepID=UPI0024106A0E|nr:hypothetical protein [Caulobacter segnis]MDG2520724.1 hypothetical protein [Caulobacter segnis]
MDYPTDWLKDLRAAVRLLARLDADSREEARQIAADIAAGMGAVSAGVLLEVARCFDLHRAALDDYYGQEDAIIASLRVHACLCEAPRRGRTHTPRLPIIDAHSL